MDKNFVGSNPPPVLKIKVAHVSARPGASPAARELAMQRDPRSPRKSNVIPFPRRRPSGQIALGLTIGGSFIRFSPELRARLARIAAENGRRLSRRRA